MNGEYEEGNSKVMLWDVSVVLAYKVRLQNLIDKVIYVGLAGPDLVQNEYGTSYRYLLINERPKLCVVLQAGY